MKYSKRYIIGHVYCTHFHCLNVLICIKLSSPSRLAGVIIRKVSHKALGSTSYDRKTVIVSADAQQLCRAEVRPVMYLCYMLKQRRFINNLKLTLRLLCLPNHRSFFIKLNGF